MAFRDRLQAAKEWMMDYARYDPVRERQQWEKVKTGVSHAGAGMVGLAARSRETITSRDIHPLRFLLFLLVALAIHLFIETQTSNIFSVERVAGHLIMFLVFCPLILDISLRERFEELFTVFFIALFLPLIFMWISAGLSWAGIDVQVTVFSYFTNLFLVPVWIYYAVFQEHVDARWGSHSLKNFLGGLIMLFWIIFIIISIMQNLHDKNLEQKFQWGDISAQYKETARERVKEIPGMLKNAFGIFGAKVTDLFRRPIQYAVGEDYFIGTVEKSKEEKVGVYIENLRAAAPQFFEDEPVTVWGTLKAKTLQPDKTIHVVTECVAIPSSLASVPGLQNRIIGDANPENPSSLQFAADVANYEHLDLSCEFPPGLLQRGSRKIAFNTTFDFSTDGYLKSHFMDQDRVRSLVMENINPLTQYGVIETLPVAIYTNGPVGIGMETTRTEHGALIPVTTNTAFRFGITIENKWEGRIHALRSVMFRLPAGTHVVQDSCDFSIEEVPCSSDNPEAQLILCSDADATVLYRVSASSRRDSAGVVAKRGLDVINRLFMSEQRKYVSLTCKVGFDTVEAVLGTTPLATHYFKASVDYDYVLEKSVSTTIKPVREFLSQPVPGLAPLVELPKYEVPKSEEELLRKIWATYSADITMASQQSGVPKGIIVAIIASESGGNPAAISKAGAVGLGGFMRYKRFAFTVVAPSCCLKEPDEPAPYYCANELRRCGSPSWCAAGDYTCSPDPNDSNYDDRFNPQHSILSIGQLLATDITTYKNYAARVELALVAYNGGSGVATAAAKATGSSNPTWPEIAAQITPSLIRTAGKEYRQLSTEKLQEKANEILKYVSRVKARYDAAEAIVEGIV